MAILEADHLALDYGTQPVLRDLSLSVEAGEFFVLLGPSGCGKSTTLRVLAGLAVPRQGSLRMQGQDVARMPPHQRDVGMVFQELNLYPHLTVRGNLEFGLRSQRLPRCEIDQRMDEIARVLNLAAWLDRLPQQLSGGQQQRVALARALVRRPRLLLLDEPLAHVDPDQRHQLRDELRQLHRRFELTTIHVTHDQTEAFELADRIACMREGTILQVGTPCEIYQRPAHLAVAQFFGAASLCDYPGSMAKVGTEFHFRTRDEKLPTLAFAAEELPVELVEQLFQGPCELTMAIRPEDWEPAAPDSRRRVTCEIDGITFLGAGTLIRSTRPDVQRWVTTHACSYRIGEELSLTVDVHRLHWFRDDGRRF